MKTEESYSLQLIKTEVKPVEIDGLCDSEKVGVICSICSEHFPSEDLFFDHQQRQRFELNKENLEESFRSSPEDFACSNNFTDCLNAMAIIETSAYFAGHLICNTPKLKSEEEIKFEYEERSNCDTSIRFQCSKCDESYLTETEFLDHIKQHHFKPSAVQIGTNKDCQSLNSKHFQDKESLSQVLEINTFQSSEDNGVFNFKPSKILPQIRSIADLNQPLIAKKFRIVYKRKKRNLPLSNNVDSLLHGEEISQNLLHTSDLAFKSENKSLNNVNAVPSLANTNEEESKIVDDSVETLSPSKVIFKTSNITTDGSISEVNNHDGTIGLIEGNSSDVESLVSVCSPGSDDDNIYCDAEFQAEASESIVSKESNSEEEQECPSSSPHCTKLMRKPLLDIPMQSHIKDTSYYCQNCNHYFKDEATLWKHMKYDHSFKKLHKCRLCSIIICGPKSAIRKHFNKCQHNQSLSCDICSFQCHSKVELKVHMVNHENMEEMMERDAEKPHKCKECSFRTTTGRLLWKHTYKIHFPTREKNFKCNKCPYKIDRSDSFQRHLRKHGLQRDEIEKLLKEKPSAFDVFDYEVEKPFKCLECSFCTTTKSYLISHQKVHAEVGPFNCPHCTYSGMKKISFTNHVKTHFPDIYKKLKCDTCPFKTNRRRALQQHTQIHTRELPISCELCDYKCQYNQRLKIHMSEVHGNDKPFKCSKCRFRTAWFYELKNHDVVHSEVKPFKCQYCEFATKYKKSLRGHVKRLHSDSTNLQETFVP